MTLAVRLPDAVERRLRDRALTEGTPVEKLAAQLLASVTEPANSKRSSVSRISDMIDHDYQTECEADRTPEVTLDEIRAALSKIPGRMTADYRAERDER